MDDLLETLVACETAVWEALRSGDAAADSAALHTSFLGIYPDGFSGKADHVGQLADGPTVKTFDLSQFHARALGSDHACLSYRAVFTRSLKDRDEVMWVTSVWQRDRGGWVNVLSQDTPSTLEN